MAKWWNWDPWNLDQIEGKLDLILAALTRLAKETQANQEKTMASLDDLTAQVAANVSVEGSAVALIQGIAAQLAAAIAANNPAALTALQAELNTSATALAAAVSANTPAAP